MDILYYAGLDVFYLILLACLAINILLIRGRIDHNRSLLVIIGITILFIIIDMTWGLIESGNINVSILPHKAIFALYGIGTMLCACAWSIHIRLVIGIPNRKDNGFLAWILIPLILMCLLDISSIWTGWFFDLDEITGTYVEGNLIFLEVLLPVVPLIYSSFLASLTLIRTPMRPLKKMMFGYAIFWIPACILSIADVFIDSIPVIPMGFSIAFIIFVLATQNSMIKTDVQTGLDNRFEMNRKLYSVYRKHRWNGSEFALAVFDIDALKLIVDTAGHVEVAKIVKNVGEELSRSCKSFMLTPTLIMNDEFAVVCDGPRDELEDACVVLMDRIERMNINSQHPIHISYGIADSNDEFESVNDIIILAENRMREAKNDYYDKIGYGRRK